jgi:hypothetical protein
MSTPDASIASDNFAGRCGSHPRLGCSSSARATACGLSLQAHCHSWLLPQPPSTTLPQVHLPPPRRRQRHLRLPALLRRLVPHLCGRKAHCHLVVEHLPGCERNARCWPRDQVRGCLLRDRRPLVSGTPVGQRRWPGAFWAVLGFWGFKTPKPPKVGQRRWPGAFWAVFLANSALPAHVEGSANLGATGQRIAHRPRSLRTTQPLDATCQGREQACCPSSRLKCAPSSSSERPTGHQPHASLVVHDALPR